MIVIEKDMLIVSKGFENKMFRTKLRKTMKMKRKIETQVMFNQMLKQNRTNKYINKSSLRVQFINMKYSSSECT